MKLLSALLLLGLASAPAPGFGAEGAGVAELPFAEPHAFPDAAYPLVAKARVVWLGEMHGTNEAPALLLGMIRLIGRHDRPPVVALELPAAEQAGFDAFLARGDDTALRNGRFFRESRDGRSGRALITLLTALRTEKIAALVCFDPRRASSGQDRDEKMAEGIAEAAATHPAAKLVVLSGNIHSRVTVGTDWDPKFRPAAHVLSQKLGPVLSFNLRWESGTAWYMTEKGAGLREVKDPRWKGKGPAGAAYFISCGEEPVDGHRGVIFTRTVSASLPWLE